MIFAAPSNRKRSRLRLACRLAIAAGLFASAQVAAERYVAQVVGDWTVAASKDGKGCFLTRTYEGNGRTTLLFGLDADNANHLSVLNDDWSIRQKDRLALDFRLSNGRYSKVPAIGIESNGKKGFVTDFETKFPDYFARSAFLHIFRGEVPVERLDLDGSGAAVAELRRCVATHSAPARSAKGRTRAVQIPKDPFARDSEERTPE